MTAIKQQLGNAAAELFIAPVPYLTANMTAGPAGD
jgi:hypothetical protein